ncbi:MAG: hypothetical protein IJQ37_00840 [Clostridia bacterium]|nr:hypothetical protein [Clostridia bacterium]
MSEELKCPICGQPTRVYMGNARRDRLCAKHADELKSGRIVINEDGLYVEPKTGTVLNPKSKPTYQKPHYVKPEAENQSGEETAADAVVVKCIACGKETKNGNLFCISCYLKYKDKQLLVKVTKCKEIEIMDESYEGVYKCKDGHIVKSKSEREIDNYLFDHGIPHAYEKAISIDADREHDLHPDFYLPNYLNNGKDVYIEHWGFNSNNRNYTKSKKYKIDIYKEKGLTIISTNEKDMNDPEASLDRKLNHFKYDTINFAEEE